MREQLSKVYYQALMVANTAMIYPNLNFQDDKAIKRYYGLLLSQIDIFYKISKGSIGVVNKIITREDKNMEEQYPELNFTFSAM